ncbi:alpha/beta hydrolase [Renibacterium salmoninarum]|uniref:alpha/beta hydrolase n=1 Tax=Renibacterium salmoninarum TaxID=1646 RepID=UPI0002EACD6E|nr:alpha/beta hydrolase-fold protein [Renibacterium salmoninarum]
MVHGAVPHDITSNPAQRVICGQSFGGLAAFFAARLRPEVFGSVLSQSGSFWWPQIDASDGGETLTELQNGPRLEARVILQFGSLEGSLTDSNRLLATALSELETNSESHEISGGHDWAWWHAELGSGLRSALASASLTPAS